MLTDGTISESIEKPDLQVPFSKLTKAIFGLKNIDHGKEPMGAQAPMNPI